MMILRVQEAFQKAQETMAQFEQALGDIALAIEECLKPCLSRIECSLEWDDRKRLYLLQAEGEGALWDNLGTIEVLLLEDILNELIEKLDWDGELGLKAKSGVILTPEEGNAIRRALGLL